MRPDLYGLLKMLLPHAAIRITLPKIRHQSLVWLLVDKKHLNMLLAILRYHSLFYSTRAIDANGYEIGQKISMSQHQYTVIYVFELPR